MHRPRRRTPRRLLISHTDSAREDRHVVPLARHRGRPVHEDSRRVEPDAVHDVKRHGLLPDLLSPVIEGLDVAVPVVMPGRPMARPQLREHADALEVQDPVMTHPVERMIDRLEVEDRGEAREDFSGPPERQGICLGAQASAGPVDHAGGVIVAGGREIGHVIVHPMLRRRDGRVVFDDESPRSGLPKVRSAVAEPEQIPVIAIRRGGNGVDRGGRNILTAGGHQLELVFDVDGPVRVILHHEAASQVLGDDAGHPTRVSTAPSRRTGDPTYRWAKLMCERQHPAMLLNPASCRCSCCGPRQFPRRSGRGLGHAYVGHPFGR